MEAELESIQHESDNNQERDSSDVEMGEAHKHSYVWSYFTRDQENKKATFFFNDLLLTYLNDWDVNNLYDKIAEEVPIGCLVPPPNIVILEPGDNSNYNENVHNACDIYY